MINIPIHISDPEHYPTEALNSPWGISHVKVWQKLMFQIQRLPLPPSLESMYGVIVSC
jgi:hypothetical protein